MATTQPLGRKVNLAAEVEGLLPAASLDLSGAYSLVQDVLSLGTTGIALTTPRDSSGHVGSKKLFGGTSVTIQDFGDHVTITVPPNTIGGTGDMLRSVYDVNNDGFVDHAALADSAPWSGLTGVPALISAFAGSAQLNTVNLADGAVTTAKLAAASVTVNKLAPGAAVGNLGYTPLSSGGGTTGQLILLAAGPAPGPNAFSGGQLVLETNATLTGLPTMGFWNNVPGASSGLAVSWAGGTADLALSYSGGQTGTLLSTLSTVPGAQLAAGSVSGAALGAGAAVANLGYTPVNLAGDTMTAGLTTTGLAVTSTALNANANVNITVPTGSSAFPYLRWTWGTVVVAIHLDATANLSVTTAGAAAIPQGRLLTSGGYTVDGKTIHNAIVSSVRTNLDTPSFDDAFNGLANFEASANQYPRYGFTVPGKYGATLYAHDATGFPAWANAASTSRILTTQNITNTGALGGYNAYGRRYVIPLNGTAPATADGDLIYEY